MSDRPLYMAPGPTQGLLQSGTIDLTQLPAVNLGDGSWGTVHSESREVPGIGEVLYPTIVNGRQVSSDEAFQHAIKTGRHLGVFKDGTTADRYAQRLHEDWQAGRIPGVQMQPGVPPQPPLPPLPPELIYRPKLGNLLSTLAGTKGGK